MKWVDALSITKDIVQCLTTPVELVVGFVRSHSKRQEKRRQLVKSRIENATTQDLVKAARSEYAKLTPAHRAMASALTSRERFVSGSLDISPEDSAIRSQATTP